MSGIVVASIAINESWGVNLVEAASFRNPLLSVARAAARALKTGDLATEAVVPACLRLLQTDNDGPIGDFARSIRELPVNDQHYWIGTFYTLLLSPEARRAQAAYFTPPYLAEAVIDIALQHGFDLGGHDVLDPAAGGAAFLSLIANRMKRIGFSPKDIVHRLNGIEIDPRLAEISEALIAARLDGYREREIIAVGDALRTRPLASYNLVIANPPYGRITAADLRDEHWKKISNSGHINKYAVFTEFCFRMTKPGGLVAMVIPSSFRAGPFYDRMREFIRSNGQVLVLGSVHDRDDVFADVAQDVSVLVVKKGDVHQSRRPVAFPVFTPIKVLPGLLAPLPSKPSMPWALPSAEGRGRGGATLADYGASVKAGYFVWNREAHKLSPILTDGAFPLIWAKNVRPGQPCVPEGKKGLGIDFVQVAVGSQAIITGPAIVLQRTTNNKQERVLIAAEVAKEVIGEWGGFLTENHTIVITAKSRRMIGLLTKLLNTRAVDARYRDVSGTASVSVKLLRDLDLPRPEIFRAALSLTGDSELAAERAYQGEVPVEVGEPAI